MSYSTKSVMSSGKKPDTLKNELLIIKNAKDIIYNKLKLITGNSRFGSLMTVKFRGKDVIIGTNSNDEYTIRDVFKAIDKFYYELYPTTKIPNLTDVQIKFLTNYIKYDEIRGKYVKWFMQPNYAGIIFAFTIDIENRNVSIRIGTYIHRYDNSMYPIAKVISGFINEIIPLITENTIEDCTKLFNILVYEMTNTPIYPSKLNNIDAEYDEQPETDADSVFVAEESVVDIKTAESNSNETNPSIEPEMSAKTMEDQRKSQPKTFADIVTLNGKTAVMEVAGGRDSVKSCGSWVCEGEGVCECP